MNSSEETTSYAPSFTIDQNEEYVEFFNRNGYVVIDHVLTPEEIEISRSEIWDYLSNKSNGLINPNDSESWNNDNWPSEICRNGGFMGKFPYLKKIKLPETLVSQQIQAWRNRENPLIYEAFKNCMNVRKLWVSIDRYGVMRPTKVYCKESEEEIFKEEWKTKDNWLHWDLSPFHLGSSSAGYAPHKVGFETLCKEYGQIRVQGLVTLTDCPEERGGFHCVPGFHGERFFEWGNSNRDGYGQDESIISRNFVEVPENDPMRGEVFKVPMRCGSLLIFNSQLPHGNYPNLSNQWRMVQYIKMLSCDDPREYRPALKYEKFSNEDWFGDFKPRPLGRKLLGIDDWY